MPRFLSSNLQAFSLSEAPATKWANGLGETQTLASGGKHGNDWAWRVSVARMDRDAEFSALPGLVRFLAVARGSWLKLHFDHGQRLTVRGQPAIFDGALGVKGFVPAGEELAILNLMSRGGDDMASAPYMSEWWPAAGSSSVRGLFATTEAELICGDFGEERVAIPPWTLVVESEPQAVRWRIRFASKSCLAWWLRVSGPAGQVR